MNRAQFIAQEMHELNERFAPTTPFKPVASHTLLSDMTIPHGSMMKDRTKKRRSFLRTRNPKERER